MKFKKVLCVCLVIISILILASCGFNPDKEDISQYVKLGDIENFSYDELSQRYMTYRESNAHTHGGFYLKCGDIINMYITCEVVGDDEDGETVYISYDAWSYGTDNQLEGYVVGVNDNYRMFDKCLRFNVSNSNEVSNAARLVTIGTSFSFIYQIPKDADVDIAGRSVRFTILVTKIVPTGKYYSVYEESEYSDESIRDYVVDFFGKYESNKTTISEGDWVVIDYEGKLSGTGKEFSGDKASDVGLRVGDGYLWPGFEKELIGKNINEEFSVTFTVPSTYSNTEIAGKEVDFTVKIKKIYDTQKTVKDNTGLSSLGELKNEIRLFFYTKYTLMDLVSERSTKISTPPKMYEQYRKFNSDYVNKQVDEFIAYYEENYNTSYTKEQAFQYLFSATGMDLYINTLTENDVFNVLVAYSVKKALGFEYTDEDYKKDLKAQVIAENTLDKVTYTEKDIENMYTKERLRGYFIQAKCVEYLFERIKGLKYIPEIDE